MLNNGKRVVGSLIVRGALHQTSDEDAAAGEWVTRTFSASFAIEGRGFAGTPRPGDRANIGPEGASLDYWAVVSEVVQDSDGSIQVVSELDLEAQKDDVEANEVSDEYEVLTMYGHAVLIDQTLIDERRTPLSELND